jgi:hypothetical protein
MPELQTLPPPGGLSTIEIQGFSIQELQAGSQL